MHKKAQGNPLASKSRLAILFAIVWLCAGCRTIRGTFMSINNQDMLGEASPGIMDGRRLEANQQPEALMAPESASAENKWTLFTFFLPT